MADQLDIIDSTLAVKTPENIAFQYGVAGPFRRLPAYLIDLAVRWAISIALVIAAALIFGELAFSVMVLGYFVLEWFYGGLFETFMNGQTPGKWVCGLRTVAVDGQPITAMQAIVRNLLRGVDLFMYMPIGLFAAGMNPRFQRLGDLACGTMVIIEDSPWLTGVARLEDPRAIQLAGYIPQEYNVSRTLAKALSTYVERRRFFSLPRRRELARPVAAPLLEQFGLPPDTSYDLMLCALYYRTFVADRADDEKHLEAVRNSNPFVSVARGA